MWEKSWELARWEHQDIDDALEAHMVLLKKSLTESQTSFSRQQQLKAEAEKMLPNDRMRTYQEVLSLRECVHLQDQENEDLRA